MKKLLFILASKNFRDLEFIVPKTILEQNGFDIETSSSEIESVWRFWYEVYHDFTIDDIVSWWVSLHEFQWIVFVWWSWSLDFIWNKEMKKITLDFYKSWKLVAAICAAPRVLLSYGILKWKNVIWNDWDNNFWNMCEEAWACYSWREKWVEVDENTITAYWPEVVESFANEIVKYFK